ncbi:competence protein CoiA family protein [Streptomyces albogriseolus]|uniref:competence protein CoiA family protein n=1 Tax=Streptomyces albogriseolus TaxID=1887 RepID=UPI0037B84096
MPIEEEDTRKVQTAVAGSPGADRPVYLPMDAASYDHFIREYPTREFYCGTLLGGCGKKLSARKYRDKKCHFAHVVSGGCRRVSTNEASADHLYMGRAVAAWLKTQKCRNVQVRYTQRRQSLRELVDITYTRDGSPLRHLMRIQLARRSKAEWKQTDTELHRQWASVEWLFGPDSMLANWQVDRQGYAMRIQCRPSGITRVVEVGVQFPDAPVPIPVSHDRPRRPGSRAGTHPDRTPPPWPGNPTICLAHNADILICPTPSTGLRAVFA